MCQRWAAPTLTRLLRAEHAANLERLFRDVASDLWRAVFAFAAGRPAVADDAVAEAFARALERPDGIRDPTAWLYRTAFRIAAAELKRDRGEPALWPLPAHEGTSVSGLGGLLPALR